MSFELTHSGRAAVSRLRARNAQLLTEYGQNAFDRLAFENSNLPAALIFYATGKAGPDDMRELVRQGYARA